MAKKAAGKPKGRKANRAESAADVLTAAQTSFKVPTAEQVQKLVRKLDGFDTQRKAISDTAKELIAAAKEKQHLDPLALAIGRRLDKLPDEKLAVTLPHLLKYIDDLGLDKRATAQDEMFDPAELVPPVPRLRIVDETGERDIA